MNSRRKWTRVVGIMLTVVCLTTAVILGPPPVGGRASAATGDLEQQITSLQTMIAQSLVPPNFLLEEPDTWLNGLRRTVAVAIRQEYLGDYIECYAAARSYRNLGVEALARAHVFLDQGDSVRAQSYISEARTLWSVSLDYDQLANEVWRGNLAAAQAIEYQCAKTINDFVGLGGQFLKFAGEKLGIFGTVEARLGLALSVESSVLNAWLDAEFKGVPTAVANAAKWKAISAAANYLFDTISKGGVVTIEKGAGGLLVSTMKLTYDAGKLNKLLGTGTKPSQELLDAIWKALAQDPELSALHFTPGGQGIRIPDLANVILGQFPEVTPAGTSSAVQLSSAGYVGELPSPPSTASETPPAGLPVLAAGSGHSLAIAADGTVWAWGWNGEGQLGDGTTRDRSTTPVQVAGLTNAIAVAAGSSHTVALRRDGTVWAWGQNEQGQLGDGTTRDRSTPVQVQGLTNAIAVAAGWDHTVALRRDGTVWAWGRNGEGQLGDGTTTDRLTPVQVQGLIDVVAIARGASHTLALRRDGTVGAWGSNYPLGQLGDGSTTNRSTPVQVQGLTGVVAISGGCWHSVALHLDGTVWAWGWIAGPSTNRLTPVQVQGMTDVVAIAGGHWDRIALRRDGTVWAWGDNDFGQLGDGTTTSRLAPVQVQGLTDVVAIAAGEYHTLALGRDGTIWAWGSNYVGELGDGTMTGRVTPVQVQGQPDMGP